MKNSTSIKIPIMLLILTDLREHGAIDSNIYDAAVKKIGTDEAKGTKLLATA